MPSDSFDIFWRTIRNVPRDLKPIRVPQADGTEKEVYLDAWLTAATVSDYDRRDFGFLPREERDELDKAVRAFEAIAEQVDPAGPTTKQQRDEASSHLKRIMDILRVNQYRDPLSYRVDRVLETYRAKLRDLVPGVQEIHGEIGSDHEGNTLIQVYVIVEDEAARAPDFFERFRQLRQAIQHILAAQQVEDWVMVNLRTVSEDQKIHALHASS